MLDGDTYDTAGDDDDVVDGDDDCLGIIVMVPKVKQSPALLNYLCDLKQIM